jgi:hypothetical protein
MPALPIFGHSTMVKADQNGYRHEYPFSMPKHIPQEPMKMLMMSLICFGINWHSFLWQALPYLLQNVKWSNLSTLFLAVLARSTLTARICLHTHLCPWWGIYPSSLCPQHLPQCLTHNKNPVNICWIHVPFEQAPSYPSLIQGLWNLIRMEEKVPEGKFWCSHSRQGAFSPHPISGFRKGWGSK